MEMTVLLFFLLFSASSYAVAYPGEKYETCMFYSQADNKWDFSCLKKPSTLMVVPETVAQASYYCPSIDTANSRIGCNILVSDFYANGLNMLADPQGIGVPLISTQLFPKLTNTPNKCSGAVTLSNTVCNMGNCYGGCGLSNACPVGVAPSTTYTFTGKVSGDQCLFDTKIIWNNPCCFGQIQGKPPSLSGSLSFYYEAPLCTSNWICGDWGVCSNLIQTRDCNDGCGYTRTEEQACTISPTGLPIAPTPTPSFWTDPVKWFSDFWDNIVKAFLGT